MYNLQYKPQMDHTPYPENEGAAAEACCPPHFLRIYYNPSVACAERLCMAFVQLMYGPYMAYVWSINGLYSRIYR